MTDTAAPAYPFIEIPDDVKHNSPLVVRVVSNGVRESEGGRAALHLRTNREHVDLFGYTMHEWDDTDRSGHPVTLTWFADSKGAAVWLYATYHYTRVPCSTGGFCYSYAEYYALVIKDGEPTTDGPLPYCGEHLHRIERQPDLIVHKSERLLIGQHD